VSAAIEVRDVSKRFRLYHERYSSLKERAMHFGRIPFEDFWAARDISFEVAEGTTVGILGHNGSGKSTLLKCIAGILQPTSGEIVTRGRLAALLELGSGFHPELTGRENIFMNGAILGLSKRDITKVFDDIVAFAELDKFIDMQVRHYSSGMYVRLGFAVAVNVDPEILLVDEVLAVGDEQFSRKCLDRVARLQREGRTILFVTHGADLVRRICDRAIVLDHGVMIANTTSAEAVRTFRETLFHGGLAAQPHDPNSLDARPAMTHGELMASNATGRVKITRVAIEHPGTLVGRTWLLPDEDLTIRVGYTAREVTDDMLVGIAIHDEDGNLVFGTNTRVLGVDVPVANGDGEMTFEFDRVPLLDGTYLVTLALETIDEGTVYDWREQQYSFSVLNPEQSVGLVALPVKVKFADGEKQRVDS
jgi:ABC-2 type transport system ATP-binding protein